MSSDAMSSHVFTATVLAAGAVVLSCGLPVGAYAEDTFHATVEQRSAGYPPGSYATTVAPHHSVYPPAQWGPPVAWIPPGAGNYPPPPHYYGAPYPPHYRPTQPMPAVPYPALDPRQLQAELAASRAELQRTSERLETAQMLLQQAREALARNYSDHQQQHVRQTEQTAQLSAARDAMEAAQARVTGLTDELQTVRATLAQQQAQLAEYSVLKNDFAQEQTRSRQLHEDSLRLEDQRAAAESRYQSCQERLAVLDADLSKAQTEQASARQSLTEALAERDRLQNELKNVSAELETRRAELARAEASASEAIAQRDAVQAQLAALESDARTGGASRMPDESAGQSAAALAEQLDRAEAMLDAELSAKTAMQQALADATSTRERLLAQLDGLNARLAGAQSQEQATAQVQAAQNELQQQLLACNERLAAAKIAFSASGVLASTATESSADSGAAPGSDRAESGTAAELAALEPATHQAASADSDGDGVPDRLDLCPDSPDATAVDAMGCAPNVPIALTGISFRYDSDALTDASRAALDRVAGILREQPTLKLEIAGHSDSQGNAAYNLWLSEQRARSVKAYLVAQGVQADRLSARGYGGTEPIAENTTREGLARNRRVELRRLP